MRITVQPLLAALLFIAALGANTALGSSNGDLSLIQRYREALQHLLVRVDANPQLIPQQALDEPRLLKRNEREALRAVWAEVLDYYIALDALALRADEQGEQAAYYYASLGQYAVALQLIDRLENDPAIAVVLNEALPGSGIPEGSYNDFKFHYLNVAAASDFLYHSTVYHAGDDSLPPQLQAQLADDEAVVWDYGKWRGHTLTLANGVDIVKRGGHRLLFPVQAGVSEWMGDTRVYRNGDSLISPAQVKQLAGVLQPGDILLERREWYLSNVGLPGFWSHAALYVGSPEQRQRYFADSAPELEQRLQQAYPGAYRASLQVDAAGHPLRIIEAISEGVVFTSLEHSADADSVVVLRPNLPPAIKARAIERAFAFSGRPYDFDFDFQTDAALVCTELVYKAYEAGEDGRGLHLPLERLLGRLTLPANAIARLYAEEAGTPAAQLTLVSFLDGSEALGGARLADEATFIESWRRPKWHILVAE